MSGKSDSVSTNKTDPESLSKLNTMLEIRRQALDIKDRLMDSDIEAVKAAERYLEKLLNWFYHENQDVIPPQQYEAAKKDFGYFVTLIEMAIVYYKPEPHPLEKHIHN